MAKARRIYHWKHGWIPVSPEAKAYVAGKGPKPVPGKRDSLLSPGEVSAEQQKLALYGPKGPPKRNPLQLSGMGGFMGASGFLGSSEDMRNRKQEIDFNDSDTRLNLARGMPLPVNIKKLFPNLTDEQIAEYAKVKQATDGLLKSIHDDGGFTYNPRTGGLVKVGEVKGVAVAVPGTEEIIGNGDVSREDFIKGMSKVIMKHGASLADGAFLGGWYSPDRDAYMVELTELVPDREDAIRVGRERNQEGVFDLGTGEYIPTGGTGG